MSASRCLKDMTGPLSNERLTNYEPTVEEDRRGRDAAGRGGEIERTKGWRERAKDKKKMKQAWSRQCSAREKGCKLEVVKATWWGCNCTVTEGFRTQALAMS